MLLREIALRQKIANGKTPTLADMEWVLSLLDTVRRRGGDNLVLAMTEEYGEPFVDARIAGVTEAFQALMENEDKES